MSFEVEMKFPLNDTKHFVPLLRGVGAEETETQTQVDRYFNHPSRDFSETDEALRLRSMGERNVITYKGPKLDTITKTREEIEVEFERGAEGVTHLSQVLTLLGFKESLTVHKTRRVFQLDWQDREVEVLLDQVADLGQFAEIETIALEGDQDAAKECVLSLAAKLGLKDSERRSYLCMLIEKNASNA